MARPLGSVGFKKRADKSVYLSPADKELICKVSNFNDISKSADNLFKLYVEEKVTLTFLKEFLSILEAHSRHKERLSIDIVMESFADHDTVMNEMREKNTKTNALENFKKVMIKATKDKVKELKKKNGVSDEN